MSTALLTAGLRFCLDVQFWFPTWFFLLKHQGFSTSEAVLADAVFHGVLLISEIPAGRLVSSLRRTTSIKFVCAFTTIVFLLLPFTPNLPALVLTWTAWGFLWAMASGLDTAYTWELAESNFVDIPPHKFLSLMKIVSGISVALSIVFAGYLFEISPPLPFLLTAFLSTIGLILSFWLPNPSRVKPKNNHSHFGEIVQGEPLLQFGILSLSSIISVSISIRILFQPVAHDESIPPSVISFFYVSIAAAFSVGQAMGAWFSSHTVKRAVMSHSVLLIAISLVYVSSGLLSSYSIPLGSLVIILGSVICGFSTTFSEIVIAAYSSSEFRVTALSIASAISGAALLVIRPILVWLYDSFGVVCAFMGSGLVCLALLIGTRLFWKWRTTRFVHPPA